ncbi:MAG: radical SAM protein [Deltaproteobacteria bacterium]|nr:radical SAM protein [Deltaproteobacteria bacterium]
MDIVLINPNPCASGMNEATVEPPIGLAYIASMLEKEKFTCSIIDANLLGLSPEEIASEITWDPKIIGFYVNSFVYSSVRKLCGMLKNLKKNTFFLAGGPAPSVIDPELFLKDINCDALIKGEGEYAVLKIMQNIKKGKYPFDESVPGLAWFSDSRLIVNPTERIKNLDEIPFPAYHLLPDFRKYRTRSRKSPSAAMITSRGCTFSCTFCSKDIFGNKTTLRSAENVLNEIDFLVEKHKIRQIDILDDNFAQNKKRLNDILDGLIKRKYDLVINLQSGIRIENIDDEILIKFRKAGVYKLAFGVESADENVLKIHKKQLNLHALSEVVIKSRKMGFVVYGFFIIGLPGETRDAFERTLEYAKNSGFHIANFCMAVPFVNTELWRMVEKNGKFLIDTSKNIDIGFYGGKVFFEYPGFTEKEILQRYKKAYKEFYTLTRQISILLSVRSFDEIKWLFNAGLSVLKGMFSETFTSKF